MISQWLVSKRARERQAIMSTEVFNPNPTVFAPTKSSRTLPSHLKGNSLWLDDGERTFEEDESNEVEEIDQDEIFGRSIASCRQKHANL